MKHLSGAPFYGRLRALPANIRLGWKRNVSDKYSNTKFVNYGQKSFITMGPGTQWLKGGNLFYEITKILKCDSPFKKP